LIFTPILLKSDLSLAPVYSYIDFYKWKRLIKDLQNISQKNKDRATHTSLKTANELRGDF